MGFRRAIDIPHNEPLHAPAVSCAGPAVSVQAAGGCGPSPIWRCPLLCGVPLVAPSKQLASHGCSGGFSKKLASQAPFLKVAQTKKRRRATTVRHHAPKMRGRLENQSLHQPRRAARPRPHVHMHVCGDVLGIRHGGRPHVPRVGPAYGDVSASAKQQRALLDSLMSLSRKGRANMFCMVRIVRVYTSPHQVCLWRFACE